MRRVLVTGVTGFAGSHLVDYVLTRNDCEIFGIQRWRSPMENVEHFKDRIALVECDLRDASSTRDTLERVRPDWIFHLAAQSFVPTSWSAPTESLTTNVLGQLNVFEAVRRIGLQCRIQIACSSEEYGMVFEDELPIRETNPLRPLSPYAVSKVAQDLLAYQYWMSWKVDSVRTRGFNHEGPRRGPVFVASDFAKQIADIEKGRKPPIVHVGNLEGSRAGRQARQGNRFVPAAQQVAVEHAHTVAATENEVEALAVGDHAEGRRVERLTARERKLGGAEAAVPLIARHQGLDAEQDQVQVVVVVEVEPQRLAVTARRQGRGQPLELAFRVTVEGGAGLGDHAQVRQTVVVAVPGGD